MAVTRASLWFRTIGLFFTRTVIGRALVFLSLPLVLLLITYYKPTYTPPIFDAQVHYNEESWKRVSVRAILNGAEELNVPWLLVGSTPNEGTWKLYRHDPQRVLPMLVPGLTREDRDSWFKSAEIQGYIEDEILNRPYRGIGEFFLFDGQVNTPVVRMETFLCLERRSIAARPASDRTGPPIIKSAFFSRISFSTARRASLTGTPGSRSLVSITSTLKGRIFPPTFTPPLALISSTASLIPLSASQP